MQKLIILFGVSGSGKSTIGKKISKDLKFKFIDADDFHSINNINKMKRKHCDIIFANNVSQKNIGFNSDYNKVSVIDKKGRIKIISKNKKSFIAKKIVEILLDKLLIDDRNIN